jgi:ATP synthase protein I
MSAHRLVRILWPPFVVPRVLILQSAATLVVAAAAWMMAGERAAGSALLGGAACVLPNALFAARLAVAARRARSDADPQVGASRQVAAFLVGEVVKVGSTIGLLVLIAWLVPGLVWLALIIAFIAALKSPLLLAISPRFGS